MLHVFFPRLWSPERGAPMSERELSIWYECGLRPAITTLLGQEAASHWPVTYQAARIRAQRGNGGSGWVTKVVPKGSVGHLADTIRTALEHDPFLAHADKQWTRDFYFLHSVRTMDDTRFPPAHPQRPLAEFLKAAKLSAQVPQTGRWYVDVVIDVRSQRGACMQWTTASHASIVQQALGIPHDVALELTHLDNPLYVKENNNHLVDISGFRLNPTSSRSTGPFKAALVHAYTTDNRPDVKTVTGKDLLDQSALDKKFVDLQNIYAKAQEDHSSHARLKVRVLGQYARAALVRLDALEIKGCLAGFTRHDWW